MIAMWDGNLVGRGSFTAWLGDDGRLGLRGCARRMQRAAGAAADSGSRRPLRDARPGAWSRGIGRDAGGV
jgi:hypothetical protein